MDTETLEARIYSSFPTWSVDGIDNNSYKNENQNTPDPEEALEELGTRKDSIIILLDWNSRFNANNQKIKLY